MELDWAVTKVGDRRIVLINSSLPAPSLAGARVVEHAHVPRWACLGVPHMLELADGDQVALASDLFRDVGPVGVFVGFPVTDAWMIPHPTVQTLRLIQDKFGFLRADSTDSHVPEIARATKWPAEQKNKWWVFSRPEDRNGDVWQTAAIALARLHGRDPSMDEHHGWLVTLEAKLDQLRRHRRSAQVSRAFLSTIDGLLEFGAHQLAAERLEAFRASGGAEDVALPFAIHIAWAADDWSAVLRDAALLRDVVSMSTAWRVAWAALATGDNARAGSVLERFPGTPQLTSVTGIWFAATVARVAARRGELAPSVQFLGTVPESVAPDARRAIIADVRQRIADGGIKDLRSLEDWKSGDLPAELRSVLEPLLTPPATVTPSAAARDPLELFEAELKAGRAPAALAALLRKCVRVESAWRPSTRHIELIRALAPRDLTGFPDAQTLALRSLLLARDDEAAREWAQAAFHALSEVDQRGIQAIAEGLAPEFTEADGDARRAWLQLLRVGPRWTALPRLRGGADVLRLSLAVSLCEQLYAYSQYSDVISTTLSELEPVESWAELWHSRALALLLIDSLSDAGDRERAFDIAAQLWPVALEAGDFTFAETDLLTRFENASSLGPLTPTAWQLVIEALAPYANRAGCERLAETLTARAHALLARAQWASSVDDDFDASALIAVLDEHGLQVPPEVRGSQKITPTAVVPQNDGPRCVLIVGGYSDVQRRAAAELTARGIDVRVLSPGFDENVDEKKVRESLQGVERVVVVWRCILHKVTITLDSLLSRSTFHHVERVFAKGKGHTSIVAAALGEQP